MLRLTRFANCAPTESNFEKDATHKPHPRKVEEDDAAPGYECQKMYYIDVINDISTTAF